MTKNNLLQPGEQHGSCCYLYIHISRICSGDGTLSVMDIRSKKKDPIAHSEDQEDELLSIVAIKGLVDSLSFLKNLKAADGRSLDGYLGKE